MVEHAWPLTNPKTNPKLSKNQPTQKDFDASLRLRKSARCAGEGGSDPNSLPSHYATCRSDDAGVYRLLLDRALVQTVDSFSAIVDDPYTFGCIAAAKALSDVYAMGGQSKTAGSIVGFPALGVGFSLFGQ